MAMEKIKVGGFVSQEVAKINANFTDIETNYAKSADIPTVPTNVSEFTNDAGYAKSTEIPTKTSDLTNDSGYITNAAVPTKTSELTNDSGFITVAAVPTTTSELANDSGFVNQTDLDAAIAGVTVPTKTSQLANDSGYITSSDVQDKVDKVDGKGLSTEDYTTAEKEKLAGLSAPENKSFAAANWTASGGQYTYTVAAGGKVPTMVMRKDGTAYGAALVDIKMSGTNIVLTSDEAFEGYIVCV